MMMAERIVIAVGGLVAVVLQVFLAPHIAIGYGVANFIVAYCVAVAVARADGFGPLLPFVLGLVYDIISGGPVGAMAFSLTVVSMAAALVFRHANNDTNFMALAVLVAGVLLVELVYGSFFALLGYSAGLLGIIVYRIAPCFVYDALISIVLYFACARLLSREVPLQSEIRQLP